MFKHVLIPTDGSAPSSKALKHGLSLAKKSKAKVTVVHVFTPFIVGAYGDMGMGYAELQQEMRELGRTQGKKVLDRAGTVAKSMGVKIDLVLVEDVSPWRGIVNTARKKRCDVVVIGAHGRGAMSALLIGSQTNAVLAHSKTPVLVYR